MAELNSRQIAEWTRGKILQGSSSVLFSGYSIDSRLVKKNQLFFALSGEKDGHEFVGHAARNGAAGAVISKNTRFPESPFAVIQVNDTLKALQTLAHTLLEKNPVPVVGITGSTGKTTTKEFAAFLLSERYQILKSEGNYNNHLGLPLSILNLQPGHELAVLEYGMSSPGEIKALTNIAPPDVAVITNVHPVHMEFFESLDQIALAKQEILDGIRPGGTAVLNNDDPLIRKMNTEKTGKVVRFGINKNNDVKALNIHLQGWEKIDFDLAYAGQYHPASIPFFNRGYLYNFLAAAAVSFEFSISPEAVVSRGAQLSPFDMRGCVLFPGRDIKLVDDSYNSNPAALDEALKSLAVLPGKRRIAVLGDMLELGEKTGHYHLHAGQTAAKLGIDILVTAGKLAALIAKGARRAGLPGHRIYSFTDSSEAAHKFPSLVKPGDVILVKGSRGIRMEKIVHELKRMH
jgi:UDP-N-acetylmuramoyl-tripeptide--D-alanyl-D-alanine ligase